MYTATSTIITVWAPNMMQWIWDSVSGFFFTANGSQFTIVIIILFAVVCIVITAIKYIVRPMLGKKW